jgi:SAM-dependent methyltransferase
VEAYTGFAYVYDEYMDNIPYEEWGAYLLELLKENNITEGMDIADLGCGTGTVTQILDRAGYSCVGIDNAPDMLTIASEKTCESGQEIVYSLQDMRDFELPYEADAMISIADSMNYITSREDIEKVFKCVYDNLKAGGVFIFDLKTIHFFRDILADNTYAENRESSAFIWDNFYDEESRNNEYDLAVFIENEDGSFDRYEENHFQHGFFRGEVESAAVSAGLSIKAVYDAFTKDEPKEDSERLYYILEKQA